MLQKQSENTQMETTEVKSSKKGRDVLENKYSDILKEDLSFGNQVSYVTNKKEPFLRWFRFEEAFSANLVRRFLKV